MNVKQDIQVEQCKLSVSDISNKYTFLGFSVEAYCQHAKTYSILSSLIYPTAEAINAIKLSKSSITRPLRNYWSLTVRSQY